MSTTAALDHVRTIYLTAREVSHETRAEVASYLPGPDSFPLMMDPAERWGTILRERAGHGIANRVRDAGGRVVREAGDGARGRAVRRAVRNLVAAVGELASFVPAYNPVEIVIPAPIARRMGFGSDGTVTGYRPTPAAAAELDALRERVFCRLVELDELLKDHPDPLARVCAVARRIAVRLLPTEEAARVGRWFERMEADAG